MGYTFDVLLAKPLLNRLCSVCLKAHLMKIIPGYPLTAFCLVGSFLFSGCVASYHKITLHDALIDVVDSYDAMHQRQLQLEKERNAADPDHPYQKLGVYPKEVDVTFAVNANGELSGSGSANGGYGPVKAS